MKSEIDSLKRKLENASGVERVDILNQLSRTPIVKSATTNLEYSREAIDLARKTGYRQGEALALRLICAIYITLGDYPEALINCQASHKIEKELHNTQGIVQSLNIPAYGSFLVFSILYLSASCTA